VAHRRHDASTRSESYFHSLAASQPASAWGACAQAELWRTTNAQQPPPKATAFCRSAASKPFLDGQLNDPIWKETEPLELTSNLHDDSDWPAVVRLAYDAEYLFVAIQCRYAPGVEYSPADSVRPRDPDLGQHDRVDLLIDIDRDYTSFYQLTIDSRGWASDACVCDATWNPNWYIAAGQDSQYWTVEAAIAWDELQPSPPRRQDAWAVGVQRTVPQVGFQSWSRPAAVDARAEGFGLLIFQ
jgi:hypothetical protein